MYTVPYYDSELYHYGVKGMKWGIRRTPAQLGRSIASKYYGAKEKYYTKKSERLSAKADKKRNSTMNTPGRRIKYASKEARYAAAEKFYNKKALGLTYVSKLFGTTLDYRLNSKLAERSAILKEKYGVAKKGETARVNRIQYRADVAKSKAERAANEKFVVDQRNTGLGRREVDKLLNERLGDLPALSTMRSGNPAIADRDRTARTVRGTYGYAYD